MTGCANTYNYEHTCNSYDWFGLTLVWTSSSIFGSFSF